MSLTRTAFCIAALCMALPLAARGAGPVPLIPRPVIVEEGQGHFDLLPGTPLILPHDAPDEWKQTARIFAEKVKRRHSVAVEVMVEHHEHGGCGRDCVAPASGCQCACVPCKGAIVAGRAIESCGLSNLLPPEEVPRSEGYKIHAGESVLVFAQSAHGFHNALMTLLQMIQSREGNPRVACADIVDYPRFGWRGMLIDPARSYLPPDVVKRYIDILSELKINRLHWHLVDDQGWRVESKRYPRLHQTGGTVVHHSHRKLSALARVQYDRHGRRTKAPRFSSIEKARNMDAYYTQEEIKEIVAFAAERYVMVVPEIDVPGHCSAMLAAYPGLSCSGATVPLRKGPGIYRTALCPAKEEVYEFLDGLFDELSDLFPAPYVHIGSDEVMASDWMDYPGNVELMKKHGYKDKHDLQAHFVRRVNDILSSHGKTMIAWDEVTLYAPEGSVVQAWRMHSLARVAAEKGNDAIVSPVTHCYIDYPQLGFTLKNLYSFEPTPEGLDPDLHHHVLGGEVNLWGERVTLQNIDDKAFPRVLAHAEVVWSPPEAREWDDFIKRLGPVKSAMKERGVGFGATWRTIFSPFD